MITFSEMLDSAERLSELLKSISNLETAIQSANEDLAGYRSMLEYAHTRNFKNSKEALRYIDKVLIPQLNGIRDSLETGTNPGLKQLTMANDLAERLVVRLRMLVNGSASDILP